jgi:SAM-dependent methyltransferase
MEISEAYDRVPYPSKFFNLTNPDHLAVRGKLLGLNPAPAESCRVLELGCGNGSNLIAHAYKLKDASFVGIDISGGHIEAAVDSLRELGLKNIEFRRMDVMDLSEGDFGKFDYIIAHGLISWIPAAVRKRVFRVCSELLNEQGIGFISYSAFPGSYYRMMVRDIIRFHTADMQDPEEKVQGSLKILSMLAENSTDKKIHKPIFEHELERHFKHSVSDIYHDDLSDFYHPLNFYQFNELLTGNGLQFLCEAELHAMSLNPFSEEVRSFALGIPDLIRREQYLDYFRGRVFRQTLFCREGLRIDREPDPAMLDKFLVATSMKPDSASPDLGSGKVVHFIGNRGQGIQIDLPLTKAALFLLGQAWGKAVGVPELLQSAKEFLEQNGITVEDPEAQEATTKTILLRIFENTDLIEFHTTYPDAEQSVSEMPKLNRLARWQLGTAMNITSLFGLNVEIRDEVSVELLKIADGSRTKAELLQGVEDFVENAGDSMDRNELPDDLGLWVYESLAELARLGVFEA